MTEILRPKPRRPFDLAESESSSPSSTPSGFNFMASSQISPNSSFPHRSQSSAALNASTLSGIYPANLMDEPATPIQISRIGSVANMEALTNGQSTPSEVDTKLDTYVRPAKFSFVKLALRLLALFTSGVGFGLVVLHFHDPDMSVVAAKDRWKEVIGEDPRFVVYWGLAGMTLGSLLPTLDLVVRKYGVVMRPLGGSGEGLDWSAIMRSIGAFVGIAFAIRRLAWESTLQISLTLALANPFLWYIIDRTKTGFWFATVIAIAGCQIVLQIAPGSIQLPNSLASNVAAASDKLVFGFATAETVALQTWISSVMFCACVCFGNIGRLFQFRGSDIV